MNNPRPPRAPVAAKRIGAPPKPTHRHPPPGTGTQLARHALTAAAIASAPIDGKKST